MALDEYRVFIRVVEHASFTDAARSLGVSKSFVSKQVSRLEDRLGVRLLNRTTRQVSPTPVGVRFYQRTVVFLTEIDDAEAEAQHISGTPRGALRVAFSLSFGLQHLSSIISEFLVENPHVKADVDYSDRKVDVVAEGFDVAVRIGSLADSSLVGRKLAQMSLHVVASAAYWDEHGRPEHPKELAQHHALLYRYVAANHTQTWDFRPPGREHVSVRVSGRLLTNTGESLRDAAVAGLGIAHLPDFLVHEEIKAGQLEPLLEEWRTETSAIWAIFPHNRHVSATVRAFVDFLAERIQSKKS